MNFTRFQHTQTHQKITGYNYVFFGWVLLFMSLLGPLRLRLMTSLGFCPFSYLDKELPKNVITSRSRFLFLLLSQTNMALMSNITEGSVLIQILGTLFPATSFAPGFVFPASQDIWHIRMTFSTPRFLPISNFRLQHLILLALRLQKGIESWNFSWHNFGVLKRHSEDYFGFPFWNQRCQNICPEVRKSFGIETPCAFAKNVSVLAFFFRVM